jgi:hypothetical protein
MSIDEQTYHSIDAYLSGELQGRKLDLFKAELKTNKELQKAVTLQEAIIKAINTNRETELKAYLNSNVNGKKIIALNPKWRIALVSAAAIALLAVIILTLSPLLSDKGTTTAQKSKTPSEQPDKSGNSEHINIKLSEEKATKIDTQTLAVVAPPAVQELQIDEDIEDYKTDPSEEMDMAVEEEMASDDESEKYSENTLGKERVIEKATTTANAPIAAKTKDADLIVRSDELLGSKSYSVYAVALNLKPAIQLSDIQIESTRQSRRDRKEAKKSNEDAAETEDYTAPASIASRAVKVEYWKSVVNYKGYQYNGSQVKLYGIDQQKGLEFKELDNRLYVKLDGKQYFLEKNEKYNRMTVVTNPTLLKVLNE